MSAPPPPDRSIAATTAAIGAGELSAVGLAQAYLDRIDAFDPALNVYRTVTRELALEQAAAVDEAAGAGRPLGPLAGVPIALKDNIAVSGFEMTAGTRHRAGVVADEDAPVYERLRDAGAVLLGKLGMSEWAIGATNQNIHYGDVHNPWDTTRVSGGSSGGSGAAIGADLAAATLGTDTGGSVRIPAALNGCCGLRPDGRAREQPGLDPGGVDVRHDRAAGAPGGGRRGDAARHRRLRPRGPRHRRRPRRRLRRRPRSWASAACGSACSAAGRTDSTPTCGRAWRRPRHSSRGWARSSWRPSSTGLDEAIEWTAELLLAEAAWVHRERLRDCPEIFADDVLQRLRRGESISGAHYGRGREWQRAWRRRVLDTLSGCDLLLVPSAARHAPTAAESEPLAMTGVLARYTGVWVLSGTPALSVPIGFVDDMPVAMQLVGRPFEEGLLLRAAAAYQSATDWHLRRPDSAGW